MTLSISTPISSADSIEIQDVHNVLIDASVSRNLTAMDGNVSVVSSTGEIQFDNGVLHCCHQLDGRKRAIE